MFNLKLKQMKLSRGLCLRRSLLGAAWFLFLHSNPGFEWRNRNHASPRMTTRPALLGVSAVAVSPHGQHPDAKPVLDSDVVNVNTNLRECAECLHEGHRRRPATDVVSLVEVERKRREQDARAWRNSVLGYEVVGSNLHETPHHPAPPAAPPRRRTVPTGVPPRRSYRSSRSPPRTAGRAGAPHDRPPSRAKISSVSSVVTEIENYPPAPYLPPERPPPPCSSREVVEQKKKSEIWVTARARARPQAPGGSPDEQASASSRVQHRSSPGPVEEHVRRSSDEMKEDIDVEMQAPAPEEEDTSSAASSRRDAAACPLHEAAPLTAAQTTKRPYQPISDPVELIQYLQAAAAAEDVENSLIPSKRTRLRTIFDADSDLAELVLSTLLRTTSTSLKNWAEDDENGTINTGRDSISTCSWCRNFSRARPGELYNWVGDRVRPLLAGYWASSFCSSSGSPVGVGCRGTWTPHPSGCAREVLSAASAYLQLLVDEIEEMEATAPASTTANSSASAAAREKTYDSGREQTMRDVLAPKLLKFFRHGLQNRLLMPAEGAQQEREEAMFRTVEQFISRGPTSSKNIDIRPGSMLTQPEGAASSGEVSMTQPEGAASSGEVDEADDREKNKDEILLLGCDVEEDARAMNLGRKQIREGSVSCYNSAPSAAAGSGAYSAENELIPSRATSCVTTHFSPRERPSSSLQTVTSGGSLLSMVSASSPLQGRPRSLSLHRGPRRRPGEDPGSPSSLTISPYLGPTSRSPYLAAASSSQVEDQTTPAEGDPLQEDSTFSRQSSPEELVLPPTVVELVDEFAGRRSYFISDASELLAALTSGNPPPGPEPRYADPDVSIYDHPAASSSSSTHQYLHEQSAPAGLSQVQENAPPRPKGKGPLRNLFRADPRTLGKFVLASVFGELQGRNWRLPADPESETALGDDEHSGRPRRGQWKKLQWLREHVNPLLLADARARLLPASRARRDYTPGPMKIFFGHHHGAPESLLEYWSRQQHVVDERLLREDAVVAAIVERRRANGLRRLPMAWVRSRARRSEEARRVREFVVEKSGPQLTYAWLMREEVREVESYLAYLRKKLEEFTARYQSAAVLKNSVEEGLDIELDALLYAAHDIAREIVRTVLDVDVSLVSHIMGVPPLPVLAAAGAEQRDGSGDAGAEGETTQTSAPPQHVQPQLQVQQFPLRLYFLLHLVFPTVTSFFRYRLPWKKWDAPPPFRDELWKVDEVCEGFRVTFARFGEYVRQTLAGLQRQVMLRRQLAAAVQWRQLQLEEALAAGSIPLQQTQTAVVEPGGVSRGRQAQPSRGGPHSSRDESGDRVGEGGGVVWSF